MRRNEIITLTVLMSIFLAMSVLIVSADAGVGVEVDASVNPAVIELGDTTRVGINLTGSGTSEMIFPLDVVLTMDCSGSMSRYGTIIAGTNDVTLGTSDSNVGNFTLEDAGEVEVMLQIPIDIYYGKDRFSAYLKNKATGATTNEESSFAAVRFSSVQPGEYEVWAKRCHSSGTAGRTFAVELPPERMITAKEAAKNFVDILKSNDHVALVQFRNYNAEVRGHLDEPKSDIYSKIDSLNPVGGTPMGEGIAVALDHFDAKARAEAVKAIILLTDGWWNTGAANPMDQAVRAAGDGIPIYTIGWGGVNETLLMQIADMTGGRSYFPATPEHLQIIYNELAIELSNITASNVTLSVELSNDVAYAGNPSKVPVIDGKNLMWDLGTISVNQTKSISFDVRPSVLGNVQINTDDSKVTYEDIFGVPHEEPVPICSVKVVKKKVPPVAIFTVSNLTPATNQSIIFDASASYDPDGEIVTYRWNFNFSGDDNWDTKGNVVKINHSYNKSGIYTVKLEVEDNIELNDSTTKEIVVSGEGGGQRISGNVSWNGNHSFEGLKNTTTIGRSRTTIATAHEITNNLNASVNVTVELHVDGMLLNRNTETLGPYEPKDITVSATWVPMSSGVHLISLHAYDGPYWVGPTNDPEAEVKVFIEKVT